MLRYRRRHTRAGSTQAESSSAAGCSAARRRDSAAPRASLRPRRVNRLLNAAIVRQIPTAPAGAQGGARAPAQLAQSRRRVCLAAAAPRIGAAAVPAGGVRLRTCSCAGVSAAPARAGVSAWTRGAVAALWDAPAGASASVARLPAGYSAVYASCARVPAKLLRVAVLKGDASGALLGLQQRRLAGSRASDSSTCFEPRRRCAAQECRQRRDAALETAAAA